MSNLYSKAEAKALSNPALVNSVTNQSLTSVAPSTTMPANSSSGNSIINQIKTQRKLKFW